jgi:hypothetical protein
MNSVKAPLSERPRKVQNYRVQELVKPDSCEVCEKRYLGMVSEAGNVSQLSCTLACATPNTPCWCDQVHPDGICDSFKRGDPIVRVLARQTDFERMKWVTSEATPE